MMQSINQTLEQAIQASQASIQANSMADWYPQFKALTAELEAPADRALLGGVTGSGVSFAFVAGYQSAIESLFQMRDQRLSSLCVTESAGNHPRHIQCQLREENGAFYLHGHKQFVSGAEHAERVFVACTTGNDATGRPQLKLVRLELPTPGVQITALPPLGFVPEVSHGKVAFDAVQVTPDNVLPGDGYADYVKPFRTAEDIHVLTAILGYRMACGFRQGWPLAVQEAHIALLAGLHNLAKQDVTSPLTHLQLAGFKEHVSQLFSRTDALFEQGDAEGYAHWVRDRALLKVAGGAHLKRTESAWRAMGLKA